MEYTLARGVKEMAGQSFAPKQGNGSSNRGPENCVSSRDNSSFFARRLERMSVLVGCRYVRVCYVGVRICECCLKFMDIIW